MRYKIFGERTGLKVSELELGTGMFGQTWGYGATPELDAPVTLSDDQVRRLDAVDRDRTRLYLRLEWRAACGARRPREVLRPVILFRLEVRCANDQ